MRRRHNNRRGFTLIEIMMAMSILLVGVVGVYAIFAVGLVNHKRAALFAGASFAVGLSLADQLAKTADKSIGIRPVD